MQVLIDASGVENAANLLRGLERNAGTGRVAMLEIAELIAERNEKAWGKGAQLAEATIESKLSRGQSEEPLVATGAMKDDLTSAEKGIIFISNLELIFGTKRWYARFAQYGTVHEPKRRPLKFTPVTRKLAAQLILRHLMSHTRR